MAKKRPTPLSPDAPVAEPLEVGSSELRLPPPIASLRGTPDEARVRNWAAQAKAGTIFICQQEGCYFPCTNVRDPSGQILIEKTDNGDAFVMKCSYDTAHLGGKQYHVIPRKGDELDELA